MGKTLHGKELAAVGNKQHKYERLSAVEGLMAVSPAAEF